MDGWWAVAEGDEHERNMNRTNANVFYRRNGKSYLINTSNCTILQTSQIELDESKIPFTGRYINSKTGSMTYFSYRQEKNAVLIAIYLDKRREHESPQKVTEADNVRLVRQARMTEIMCADPESGARSKTIYKPKVGCEENKISVWANSCQEINTSRWFMMECGKHKYPIKIGNSIKVIPYPGLHDVIDVYSDPRIQWLSDDKISVANAAKIFGWNGKLTFYRCKELH
jgi:hypothetical protein